MMRFRGRHLSRIDPINALVERLVEGGEKKKKVVEDLMPDPGSTRTRRNVHAMASGLILELLVFGAGQ